MCNDYIIINLMHVRLFIVCHHLFIILCMALATVKWCLLHLGLVFNICSAFDQDEWL